MRQEAQNALRTVRRYPIRAAAATLSVAVGLGALAAAFALLNALLLKDLPIADPEELVVVQEARERPRNLWLSTRAWEELDRRQNVLAGIAAYAPRTVDIGPLGQPAQVGEALVVSGEYFRVIAVGMSRGRALDANDDRPGATPVSVVSDRFWQRELGSDPAVIGRRLDIANQPVTIVGVAAASFFGLEAGRGFDVALTIGAFADLHRQAEADRSRTYWLNVVGRLSPGQSFIEATAGLRALQAGIVSASLPDPRAWPNHLARPWLVQPVIGLAMPIQTAFRLPLLTMLALAVAVLLLACMNVASFLLTVGAEQSLDRAIQTALGAAPGRFVRESLLLALGLVSAAAALGSVLGTAGSQALASSLSSLQNPIHVDLRPDAAVFLFTVIVTGLTALVCGAVPAWRAGCGEPANTLRRGHGGDGPTGHAGLGYGVLTCQVALALILTFGGLLLVRSTMSLIAEPRGFARDRIVLVGVRFPTERIAAPRRPVLLDTLRQTLASIPGVSAAAFAFSAPFGTGSYSTRVTGAGISADAEVLYDIVDEHYLGALGLPVVSGRSFVREDAGRDVVVVNRAFAQHHLGSINVVNRRIRFSPGGQPRDYTIIGIATDAKAGSLRDVPPQIYVPWADGVRVLPDSYLGFIVRRGQADAPTARQIAAAVSLVAPSASIRVRPLDALADDTAGRERALALAATAFAGVALLLAALGVFSTLAHHVRQMERAIGIRRALGASAIQVVMIVGRRLLLATAIGLLLGGIGTSLLSRLTRAVVYGIPSYDSASAVASAALLLAIVVIAATWPVLRALRLEPATILRQL